MTGQRPLPGTTPTPAAPFSESSVVRSADGYSLLSLPCSRIGVVSLHTCPVTSPAKTLWILKLQRKTKGVMGVTDADGQATGDGLDLMLHLPFCIWSLLYPSSNTTSLLSWAMCPRPSSASPCGLVIVHGPRQNYPPWETQYHRGLVPALLCICNVSVCLTLHLLAFLVQLDFKPTNFSWDSFSAEDDNPSTPNKATL